jgi:hypothetical protein
MVTRLDRLARFLNTDTVPGWLRVELKERQAEIVLALEQGREYTIYGPAGETVKIKPEAVLA